MAQPYQNQYQQNPQRRQQWYANQQPQQQQQQNQQQFQPQGQYPSQRVNLPRNNWPKQPPPQQQQQRKMYVKNQYATVDEKFELWRRQQEWLLYHNPTHAQTPQKKRQRTDSIQPQTQPPQQQAEQEPTPAAMSGAENVD